MTGVAITHLVLDTNVFLHAHNKKAPEHEPSHQLCVLMFPSEVLLCVDDGFSLDESKNRSHIGLEYLEKLRQGSIGFELVRHLASIGRVEFIPVALTKNDRTWLARTIPKNKPDRAFAALASCTHDRLLVSHDFRDFPQRVRDKLRRRWDVEVIKADVACERLA